MTYTVGDPGHVKAHSDLVSSINVELARFSMGGALPIKEEGAEGHLDDHTRSERSSTSSRRSPVNHSRRLCRLSVSSATAPTPTITTRSPCA